MPDSAVILHYAAPPVVGGVESTIFHHARGLAARGWQVRVISGDGSPFDGAVESQVHPLFGSTAPEVLRVKRELDQGVVSEGFQRLTAAIEQELRAALAGFSIVMAHNIPTFNKNLPLTAALARLHAEGGFRLLVWAHDLAWTNPQYLPELFDGMPWDLLRRPWKDAVYVTVSEARRPELADLIGIDRTAVHVVSPGIDVAAFLGLSETTRRLVHDLNWLDADGLLLLPARITRRKNIALALRILREVRRQSDRDFRLIVTGPPGPHNPSNPGYLGELLDLRRALDLDGAAHFLYEYGADSAHPLIPDDATMANLYALADGLLFPPLSEGFGIPMLEAGLARLPIFCADIPPLRETGGTDAYYFDPLTGEPQAIAATILRTLDSSVLCRLRLRVRRENRWEAILDRQILPLLMAE
ncbi:MAG: glycosyltransferase family 4 protein [Chloroflexi bacterium]|nr:glycosyltransferase family 4 protein [Chloroflexota bacterium]